MSATVMAFDELAWSVMFRSRPGYTGFVRWLSSSLMRMKRCGLGFVYEQCSNPVPQQRQVGYIPAKLNALDFAVFEQGTKSN